MEDVREVAPQGPDRDNQEQITECRRLIRHWTNLMATRAQHGEAFSQAEFDTVRWMVAKVLWVADQVDERGWGAPASELRWNAKDILTWMGPDYEDDNSIARWVQDGGPGEG